MSPSEGVAARVAAGETVADTALVLEAAFRVRYQALVGVARLLIDGRFEAEEVVQEAFARVYALSPDLHTTDQAIACALGYRASTLVEGGKDGRRPGTWPDLVRADRNELDEAERQLHDLLS